MSLSEKASFGEASIVLIEWEDASFTDTRARTQKEIVEDLHVFMQRSVGYLVERSKNMVVIAQSQNCLHCHESNEMTFNDVLQIPASMVRKITTLKRGA